MWLACEALVQLWAIRAARGTQPSEACTRAPHAQLFYAGRHRSLTLACHGVPSGTLSLCSFSLPAGIATSAIIFVAHGIGRSFVLCDALSSPNSPPSSLSLAVLLLRIIRHFPLSSTRSVVQAGRRLPPSWQGPYSARNTLSCMRVSHLPADYKVFWATWALWHGAPQLWNIGLLIASLRVLLLFFLPSSLPILLPLSFPCPPHPDARDGARRHGVCEDCTFRSTCIVATCAWLSSVVELFHGISHSFCGVSPMPFCRSTGHRDYPHHLFVSVDYVYMRGSGCSGLNAHMHFCASAVSHSRAWLTRS